MCTPSRHALLDPKQSESGTNPGQSPCSRGSLVRNELRRSRIIRPASSPPELHQLLPSFPFAPIHFPHNDFATTPYPVRSFPFPILSLFRPSGAPFAFEIEHRTRLDACAPFNPQCVPYILVA